MPSDILNDLLATIRETERKYTWTIWQHFGVPLGQMLVDQKGMTAYINPGDFDEFAAAANKMGLQWRRGVPTPTQEEQAK